MRSLLALVVTLTAPALAFPQTTPGQPPGDAADQVRAEPGEPPAPAPPAPPAAPPAPVPDALPAPTLDVAFASGIAELHAGGTVPLGRPLAVRRGACARLVAANRAAVVLVGPAQVAFEASGDALRLQVTAGRGVLYADGRGASVEVRGRRLSVVGGAAAFDASAATVAQVLSGQGLLDGAPLPSPQEPIEHALARPDLCAPARATIEVRLGDPASLLAEAERTGSRETEAESQADAAVAGATCVDSADSSAATDPTQGTEGGIDPDARRDEGRLRVILRVPRRSR